MRAAAILLPALAGCLEAPPGPATAPDAGELDRGLVARYPMDSLLPNGVLPDAIESHDGSCATHCPTAAGGRIDGAMRFGAANQTFVTVPDAADLHLQAGTIAAWVNYDGSGDAAQTLVSKPLGVETGNSFGLFQFPSGLMFESQDCIAQSIAVPLAGQWTHVAGTWDAGTGDRRVYVDSAEEGSCVGAALAFDDNDLLIGIESDYQVEVAPLDGRLDDVRIYDRALTEVEIRALYEAGG